MTDELLVPQALAGLGVEGDEAVGKEILADAVSAPEIKRRRARRAEDDAALFVEGEPGPDVRAADVGVGVRRPSLVADLAGQWDGVEAPDEFPAADVVGADVSGCSRGRTFAKAHAHDEEIAEEHAGRVGLQGEPTDVAAEIGLEVDGAFPAEAWDALAGRGVERVEVAVVGVEDPAILAINPEDETAVHSGLGDALDRSRVEPPQLTARCGVQREGLEVGRGAVEHAVDDEGVALDLGAVVRVHTAGAVGPGHFQFGDVARRNLPECRVVGAGLVAEVGAPVGIRSRQGNGGKQEGEEFHGQVANHEWTRIKTNHGSVAGPVLHSCDFVSIRGFKVRFNSRRLRWPRPCLRRIGLPSRRLRDGGIRPSWRRSQWLRTAIHPDRAP